MALRGLADNGRTRRSRGQTQLGRHRWVGGRGRGGRILVGRAAGRFPRLRPRSASSGSHEQRGLVAGDVREKVQAPGRNPGGRASARAGPGLRRPARSPSHREKGSRARQPRPAREPVATCHRRAVSQRCSRIRQPRDRRVTERRARRRYLRAAGDQRVRWSHGRAEPRRRAPPCDAADGARERAGRSLSDAARAAVVAHQAGAGAGPIGRERSGVLAQGSPDDRSAAGRSGADARSRLARCR